MRTRPLTVIPFSDLHGYLFDPKTLPECDVACCCGDFVPLEYQNDDVRSIAWFCLEFIPWVDKLPCKHFILVAGNHDFFMEHIMLSPIREDGSRKCRTASEVLKKLLPGNNKGNHSKLIYLRDNSTTIEGITFYGTPWTTGLPGWAFSCTEEELEGHLEQMPRKVDVLLTHMPPTLGNVGTVCQQRCFNTGIDYSSGALAKAMMSREISYAFCGHVHTGNHSGYEYKEGSSVCNVSVKDENYRVVTQYFRKYEIL